jgi:hypothetical protein
MTFAVGDRVEFVPRGAGYDNYKGTLATVHKVDRLGKPHVTIDGGFLPNDPEYPWPSDYWRVIDSSESFIPEDWS